MPTLRGMTWDHPRGYDPMVATAADYARRHPDTQIVWEKRSLQAFADHPLEDLAARYDLIVMDHPHVGQAARERCLIALDETGRDDELTVLASQSLGGSHESYSCQGHQWALAIDAAAQVAAYRPDLIDTPPTSWDAVIGLAAQGRVLWPVKPVDALMSFFTIAANRGTPCHDHGDQLVDRRDMLAALEAMHNLMRHIPPRCLTMNPIQTLDEMSTEDGIAYCPLLYGYTNYARDGFRDKPIRFVDIPAVGDNGPCGSTLGGTGIAVSARGSHPELATDYAFWIASAVCQNGIYFDAGGQPGNAAAWRDERNNRLTHGFFHDTFETLDRSYQRPRYDGYMVFQDRAGDAVNRFLAGRADPEATADELDRLFKETQS